MEGIIGRRYARALLNLAKEQKKIEKVGEQIAELAAVYHEDKSLKGFLSEPKYSKGLKLKVVEEVLKKLKADDTLTKFCRYLLSKKRFGLIEWISRSYQILADQALGRAKAKLKVPYEMSDADKKKISQELSAYTGKTIELSVEVDPSIIGGAITTVGSMVLDGSIRNRLNSIHETISRGN